MNCQRCLAGVIQFRLAAMNGHFDICKFLLENMDNKNSQLDKNDNELTSLHLTAQNGQLADIKLILQNAVEKNPKFMSNWTPLHLAAKKWLYRTLQILSLRILKTRIQRKSMGGLPSFSCQKLSYRIENTADKNPKEKKWVVHFIMLSKKNILKFVKLILENAANNNPKKDDGETPLHLVAEYGQLEVCILEKYW